MVKRYRFFFAQICAGRSGESSPLGRRIRVVSIVFDSGCSMILMVVLSFFRVLIVVFDDFDGAYLFGDAEGAPHYGCGCQF